MTLDQFTGQWLKADYATKNASMKGTKLNDLAWLEFEWYAIRKLIELQEEVERVNAFCDSTKIRFLSRLMMGL